MTFQSQTSNPQGLASNAQTSRFNAWMSGSTALALTHAGGGGLTPLPLMAALLADFGFLPAQTWVRLGQII